MTYLNFSLRGQCPNPPQHLPHNTHNGKVPALCAEHGYLSYPAFLSTLISVETEGASRAGRDQNHPARL